MLFRSMSYWPSSREEVESERSERGILLLRPSRLKAAGGADRKGLGSSSTEPSGQSSGNESDVVSSEWVLAMRGEVACGEGGGEVSSFCVTFVSAASEV